MSTKVAAEAGVEVQKFAKHVRIFQLIQKHRSSTNEEFFVWNKIVNTILLKYVIVPSMSNIFVLSWGFH